MCIRRIKCNECLTGMYDFNKNRRFLADIARKQLYLHKVS